MKFFWAVFGLSLMFVMWQFVDHWEGFSHAWTFLFGTIFGMFRMASYCMYEKK